MSATRTFSPYVGSGADSAVVVGDPWRHTEGEANRQNIDVLAYLIGHIDLGGDERGISSASYVAVNGARTVDHNGDSDGGLTLEAVIFSYTSNASTSVTVRVRNTTDSSDAGTTSARTDTTVQRDVVSLTLASGIKTYQLQVTGSDAVYPVYAWGYLRLRKVPA